MTDKKLLSRLASLTPEQREALLKQLQKKKNQGAEPNRDVIRPFPRDTNRLAMSYAQQRLWFIDQLQSGNSSYNISAALRLSGALDVEALRMSFDEIVRRHEILRTTFVTEEGQGRQLVNEHQRWELPTISLEPLDKEEQDEVIRARYKGDAHTSFDLINGPLLRTRLIRLSNSEHVIIVTMHHIISDGWSMGVFIQEMALLYDAYRQDKGSPLKDLNIQYADYSVWQREWLSGQRLDRQLSYWKTKLDGVPVLELPTDFQRPPQHSYSGKNIHFNLTADITQKLNQLAKQQGVTLFMTLFASLQVLLYRYSGQEDICVGTPIAGRVRPEVEPLIGCFVNTLAIRSDLSNQPSFTSLLKQVHQNLTAAYDHQDIPFERLVDELGVAREMSHTPLFQVMFVLQNATSTSSMSIPGLEIELLPEESETSKFDITINMREEKGCLKGDWEFRTDLFDVATIERMIGHYENLLADVVQSPSNTINHLSYLSAEEKQNLLFQWNCDVREYERDASLVQVFSDIRQQNGDRVAVEFGQDQITYAQLDALSDHVAHGLVERSVGAGHRVGLCAERSIETIAALLGILKVGAAYVPLDPAYPADRLSHMIDDAETEVILCHQRLVERLPVDPDQLIHLDDFCGQYSVIAPPVVPVAAKAAAYVMYTSGSTGKPKGIEVMHRNVVRLVRNTNFMEMDSGLVFLQYAPISFDAATLEIWAPLLNGGKVVVAPPGQLTAEEIGDVIRNGQVNAAWLTAALFHFIAEYHIEELQGLTQLLAGGDVLSPKLCLKVLDELPQLTLINGYGPTENTTFTCCYAMKRPADVRATVPIGKPIANTRVYVLDGAMQPVPIGVPGELFTSGDGVANGYLNRDELTKEVFLPNPFDSGDDPVIYRTGDQVRYYPDGNIEYLGRIDQQVKIRGFRIELSEIEAAVGSINTIREVAVIAREDIPGVKYLAAYIVPGEGIQPTSIELKSELKQTLPDYMIPATFVTLEQLPVTANGKLDRKALPKPILENQNALQRVPPRTEKEIILANIWQQVLNLDEIGIRDNFFELGGDSILSIQIISRAKLAGLHLTTKQIFENQTIEELAERASEVETPIIAEQGMVMGESVLSPIQHWFFNQQFVDEHHWNQSVLLNIKPQSKLTDLQIRKALAAVVVQHDSLRLRFQRTAEGVKQFFSDQADGNSHFRFYPKDLSNLVDDAIESALKHACDEIQASLDLGNGPLLAVGYITLPKDQRKLLLVVHHLVVDGVSWRILLDDFGRALNAVQAGEELQLGYKTTSYQQWAAGLEEFVEYGHLNAELNYWRAIVEQEKPLLPFDQTATLSTVADTQVYSAYLNTELTQALLRDVHKAYRTEINDVLLTSLARTLSDWSGNVTTLLDMEGHGREIFSDRFDLSRTVGWFTSVYPVLLKYQNGQSITDNLKSIKEQLRHIPGRGFGYGALRYYSEQAKDVFSEVPSADIVFNYLGQFDSIIENNTWFELAREGRGQEHSSASHEPHPLSINSHIVDGRLQVDWIYSEKHFTTETIEHLSHQFFVAIEQLISQCSRPDVFGYTPSDFPLSGLDQGQIDRLVGRNQSITSIYPLSPMQEGMLFHSLFDNDHGVYFEQLSVEVLGGVDREVLKQSWAIVVNRHPALRSAFLWQELDRPLQIVHNKIDMEVIDIDWRHIDVNQEKMRFDAWLEKDRQRGFDFENPGLMRLAWIDMPDNRARLVWSFHHVVLDGWSLPLVMGEVFQTYGLLVKGEEATLPSAGSYEDFISYLEQVDKGDALQFWKLYLSEFEAATPLPNLKSGNNSDEKVFLENALVLDESFTTRIQNFAREQHVTLNTVLQAAWGVLLARYSGERDVVFGTTVSGRPTDLPNVENIVGLFINTLPLRIVLDERSTIGPLLKKMQEEQVDLRRFEFTPLVDIHRYSEVPGDQSLFDSILVFENYPVGEAVHSADELLDFGHITTIEHTNYPITLIIEPAKQLLVKLSYDSALFENAAIERILQHLKTLLHGMLSQPDVPLVRLPMLSEDERNNLLHNWNPAPANYPKNLCLHQIFEKHVKAHPEHIAVVCGNTEITYRELNIRANRAARLLFENGVKADDLVAIALERSVEMIVSTIAVLKVGAAYVPLDSEYPDDRVGYMLGHTAAPVVITDTAHSQRIASIVSNSKLRTQVLLVEDVVEKSSNYSGENLLLDFSPSPSRTAYVIYTSGSTGLPKGVEVNQLSVIRLVLDANYFSLEHQDRVCHLSNVSFDAATFDIWAPLLNGAGLVIYSKEMILNPELFFNEILRTNTNVSFFTTALFNMYMATKPEIISQFKVLMIGGEALDPSITRLALNKYKPKHLLNCYGPTENTTFSTFNELEYLPENASNVPIGRSISGSTAYILDINKQPVPIGVKGEIYLGGDGVAIGYLNDTERTQQSFIPDPFSNTQGARLYKTGDIARYREDGLIEILGRADDQVKIRGFRIELNEVESNLTRVDVIKDAVVLVKIDDAKQKRLVAYIKSEHKLDITEVRQKASEFLPKHMMPAAFVFMEEFPLTANGKVDKRKLPEPVYESSNTNQYVAPRNRKEEILVDIWEQVLKADTVGIHDNFFELGGDSILSIQIISRAKRAGLHLTAKQIFDFQTIGELAEVAKDVQDIILAEQGLVEGRVSLTPIQKWFYESKFTGSDHFNQSLLLKTSKTITPDHLMAAWEALILQHDALRTRFKVTPSEVQQYVVAPKKSTNIVQDIFEVVNLSGLPANLRYEQIEQLSNNAQATLNLEHGPVMRLVYFDLGVEDEARLLIVIHHLVIDVFSWRILLEDLQTALGSLLKSARIDLGSKTTSFQQWADALTEFAYSDQIAADADYWLSLSSPSGHLLADYAGENTIADVELVESALDTNTTSRLLKQAGSAYQTEINDLLLTALGRSLCSIAEGKSLVLDLEGHGREHIDDKLDVSRTVGWFTSIYPVILSTDTQSDLGLSIKSTKENLRAIPRKGMTFGVLKHLGDSAIQNKLSKLDNSEVSFNYLGQLDQISNADSLLSSTTESTGEEIAPLAKRKYKIEVSAKVHDGQLQVIWRFGARLFARSTIERLSLRFSEELTRIVDYCCSGDHCGYTPSDFPLSQLDQTQIDGLLPRQGVETVLPLSPVQEGMLFHALYEPDSWVYFDQMVVPITGAVNEKAMFDAWRTVVSRHQILRTSLLWENVPVPLQIVHKRVDLHLQEYDWSKLDADSALQKFQRFLIDDRNLGFNFKQPSIMRLNWVALPNQENRLVWSFHHILLDGWSMPVVFAELFSIYDSLVAGDSVSELPNPPRYQDFIHWQQSQDQAKAKAYWRDYLSGFTAPTPIPVKNSQALINQLEETQNVAAKYLEKEVAIGGNLLLGIQGLAKQSHLTLNHIMQGLWAILLSRYSNEHDVLFGTTVSGRPAELNGIESMVGLFINTLPMRMQVENNASFIDWLKLQQEKQTEAKNYEYSSLVDVQNCCETPLKQAMFESILVFENYPIDETLEQTQASLNIGTVEAFQQTNFPLTLIIIPGNELVLRFSYDSHSFSTDTIDRILVHIQQMLMAIESNPSIAIGDIPIISMGEHQKQVYGWNETERSFPSSVNLARLFTEIAKKRPENIACDFSGRLVTYDLLDRRTNQLARALIKKGVQAGDRVALCIDRSISMIEAVLATLKAGAVYVPVDPSYTKERIEYMLKDVGAEIIVVGANSLSVFDDLEPSLRHGLVESDVLTNEARSLPDGEVETSISTDSSDLAYVIYTSGSTGQPKGVCVPQVAVSRLVLNSDYVQFSTGDRVGHASNVSFDAATFEMWGALLNGATLVGISKEESLDPHEFGLKIKEKAISTLFLTTALFNALLKQDAQVFAPLKYCLFGGEACDPNVVSSMIESGNKPQHLLHVYGPTENTTFSTWYEITEVLPGANTIPIGKPIANSTAYILDSEQRPVPVGVAGEIFVGGLGLADGYLNKADLTAKSFVADPFKPSLKMYRTGDLGRYLDDGSIEILGRLDDQIKIRGFRVELGEVETAINRLPAIKENTVVVHQQPNTGKQLIAYCELVDPSNEPDVAELKAKLKQTLPYYMVPSALVYLGALPITPNGKVDKRALPEPTDADYVSTEYVSARNPIEATLIEIWQQVLEKERVGIFDDFFDLGGHSLLINRVAMQLKQKLSVDLPLRTLFEVPTIAALSEIISAVSISDSDLDQSEDLDDDFEEGSL